MTLFGDGAFEVVINFSGAIREFQPNLTGVLISRGVKHSEREAKAMCARVRARTHTHTHTHTNMRIRSQPSVNQMEKPQKKTNLTAP